MHDPTRVWWSCKHQEYFFLLRIKRSLSPYNTSLLIYSIAYHVYLEKLLNILKQHWHRLEQQQKVVFVVTKIALLPTTIIVLGHCATEAPVHKSLVNDDFGMSDAKYAVTHTVALMKLGTEIKKAEMKQQQCAA